MIVICQTVPSTLSTQKRLFGDHVNVFLTSNYREALDYVRDYEPLRGRTVAILCNYYKGESVDGSIISLGIKAMRPDAWCLLFTTERPAATDGVDGVIDKLDESVPWDVISPLVDAGVDDPGIISNLDSLFEYFPWIQRPVR